MADGEASSSLWTEAIISGISAEVTKDHLINFLECKLPDCHVEQVEFKKKGVALITFERPIDKQVLQLCKEVLEGQRLNIRAVDKRGAVVILNPCLSTSTNCFKFYLSNKKRSGGSAVLDIQRDDNNLFVIAYYATREDAERVAKQKHILENQDLQLEFFDPNFDEVSDFMSPAAPLSLDVVQSDKTFRKSLGTNDYDAISTGAGAVGNKDSTNYFPDAIMQEKKVKINSRNVEGLCHLYLKILEIFCDSIPRQQLQVKMEVEKCLLKIEGEQHEVEKAESLVHILCDEQASSLFVSGPAADFDDWDEVFDDIQCCADKEDCRLVIKEAASGPEKFCIHLVHAGQFVSFDQFLKQYVSLKTVPVRCGEAEELLETTTWESFVESDISDEYENKVLVKYKKEDHEILVIGNNAYLDEAVKSVELFLLNTHVEQRLDLLPTEKEFVQKFWLKGQPFLQTGSGINFAEVSLTGSSLKIDGYRGRVSHERKIMETLQKSLKCRRVILTHPMLANIRNSELWEECVENISSEHRCLIKQLPDAGISDAEEVQEDWGKWTATVIHSFSIHGQKLKLHLVEGLTDDLKVDAAILVHENYSPQGPPEQAQGARPNNEHRNWGQQGKGMRVSPSNGRPCKAVIEVNLQHYFPSHISWEAAMENLIADLFQICDDNRFASLAVPVFGVDVGDDCQPIDEATRILADCINKQCHLGDCQQRSLNHLCLCSPRAACLHGLSYSLQNDLAWVSKPPSPYSLTLLSTEVPHSGRRDLDLMAVEIIKGDIARAQVEALVVPCDIDIDLDLYKSAITKSLLRGGMEVETTLQKRTSGYFLRKNEVEDRNEELAEQRIVMGRGGNLPAHIIFYVYLPPWGPNAGQILAECVRKGLRKATDKGCRSVAMAALGVGKLEYPPACAAHITLTTVAHFLETESTSLKNVQLVVYDHSTFEVYEEEHQAWKQHVWSGPRNSLPPLVYPIHTIPGVSSSGSSVDAGAGRSLQQAGYNRGQPNTTNADYVMVHNIKLRVKIGNIIREKCNAIVNGTNRDFDLNGGVARSIHRQCGDVIFREFHSNDNRKKMRNSGIVITSGPGLPIKDTNILHLDMDRFYEKPKEFLLKSLIALLKKKPWTKSVAFPAFGTGAWKTHDRALVVKSLREALQALKQRRELEEVRVVVSSVDLHNHMLAALHSSGGHHPAHTLPSNPRPQTTYPSLSLAATAPASPPAPPSAKCSVLATKVPRSRWRDGSAMSLFIFSDSQESRQRAIESLAERMTVILGREEFKPTRPKDGHSAENYENFELLGYCGIWGM